MSDLAGTIEQTEEQINAKSAATQAASKATILNDVKKLRSKAIELKKENLKLKSKNTNDTSDSDVTMRVKMFHISERINELSVKYCNITNYIEFENKLLTLLNLRYRMMQRSLAALKDSDDELQEGYKKVAKRLDLVDRKVSAM